jgi:hypothetical protein
MKRAMASVVILVFIRFLSFSLVNRIFICFLVFFLFLCVFTEEAELYVDKLFVDCVVA